MYKSDKEINDEKLKNAESYIDYIKNDTISCINAIYSITKGKMPNYNKVVEECQAIVEKCIKGAMYVTDSKQKPSNNLIHNHQINKLLNFSRNKHFKFITSKDQSDLDNAYTASRYPDRSTTYSKEQAETFLKLAVNCLNEFNTILENYKDTIYIDDKNYIINCSSNDDKRLLNLKSKLNLTLEKLQEK